MKRLILIIVGIVVIAVLAALPLFLRLDRYRDSLSAYLSRQLQQKVVIGRMETVLFPPAVRLRELGVIDHVENTPLLEVDEVLAPLSMPALFRGKLQPKSLQLKNWTAYIQRAPNGTWSWAQWIVPGANMGRETRWPLRSIQFERGELRAADPYNPGAGQFIIQVLQGGWDYPRQYLSVNGVFTNLPAPVSFLFQATGSFMGTAKWSGVLGLTDENRSLKVECAAANDRFTATGRSDEWRFDTFYAFLRFYGRLASTGPVNTPSAFLQRWEMQLDWQGQTMSFLQTALIAGGRSEAKGSIVYLPDRAIARLELGVEEAKLAPVLAALYGNASMDGIATGVGRVELELSTAAWTTLRGEGQVQVKDGKYILPTTSTRSLAKAQTMRYLHKKYPGFLASGLNFTKAVMPWRAQNGVFRFDQAFCNMGNVRVALAGTFDAARRGIDAFVRVQIQETDPTLLRELPASYVYKGQGPAVVQPMHGRIQGTPGEWYLRTVKASKIPAAIRAKLSQAIQKK